jgi:hypothetical protein
MGAGIVSRRLLGEVVLYQGALSLQTSPNCWYPLEGASGLAHDFREDFGPPQPGDIGKRVYRVGGILQMENDEQRKARIMEARMRNLPDISITGRGVFIATGWSAAALEWMRDNLADRSAGRTYFLDTESRMQRIATNAAERGFAVTINGAKFTLGS